MAVVGGVPVLDGVPLPGGSRGPTFGVEVVGLGTGDSLPLKLGVPGTVAVGPLLALVTSGFDPDAGGAASFELHATKVSAQVAQHTLLSQVGLERRSSESTMAPTCASGANIFPDLAG